MFRRERERVLERVVKKRVFHHGEHGARKEAKFTALRAKQSATCFACGDKYSSYAVFRRERERVLERVVNKFFSSRVV